MAQAQARAVAIRSRHDSLVVRMEWALMTRFLAWLAGCLLLVWVAIGTLARAAEVEHRVVLSGLDHPCGAAVQPETGHVFLSETAAGRVIRYNPASAGEASEVITGFPTEVFGSGPTYTIGPLGLLFLGKERLVVGCGGRPAGQELVRFYTVPPEGTVINADEMKYSRGPIGPSDASKNGEGDFYALAAGDGAIFVACQGDDTKGWIARADNQGDKPGELELFIATKASVGVDAPTALVFGPRGGLIVGHMGKIGVPRDSALSIFHPDSAELFLTAPTGLHDVVGLAISPTTRKLYAVDLAATAPQQGGLYLLEVKSAGDAYEIKAEKLLAVDRPTSVTFAADGTAYVTAFGAGEGEGPAGQLIQIRGL